MRFTSLALAAVLLTACPKKPIVVEPESSGRCEVDLDDTGLFSAVGSGATAKIIESNDERIAGSYAQGFVGDFIMSNDRIRVVIQRPHRSVAPAPYGGTIIDADLVRSGATGRDTLGKLEVFYAFGRTVNVDRVEVLNDGSKGGAAVIAATGHDAVADSLNPPNVIEGYFGAGFKLVANPNEPLPLATTTYYVLSPGENRVRMLTAFCNTGKDAIVTQVGDLFDPGGESAVFNPTGCTNGLGVYDCRVDPSTWFGAQSDGVAYGYRSYTFTNPAVPATNALITIAGVSGVIGEGKDLNGLLSWLDEDAVNRPGAFGILAGKSRQYLRDFYVGKDLAEISSGLLEQDQTAKSRVTITATNADGTPAPRAHVAFMVAETGKQVTLLVVGEGGTGKLDLIPGNYLVSTGAIGAALEPPTPLAVPSNGQASLTVKIGPTRTITVNVKDPFNAGLTAKIVVTCPSGPCSTPSSAYRHLYETEDWPSSIQAIAFASAQGIAQVTVPPGKYEVFVTRGLEYSAYPDTYPLKGEVIDVTSANATIDATLAHVVDTSGWVSADLHVHAINSPDSTVPNATRVMSFAAEGVDVLVSTDHDFITDYAPLVRELGVQEHMATMIGCEVTPFDFGHQQTYPVARGDSFDGDPFDWGGGEGPTLRLDELYAGLRARDPNAVIQLNHPRTAPGGSLTALKVNTLTGESTALPETFRMAPNPAATATDTKLFSSAFDAIEVMNGPIASRAVLNDWLTFMSRGLVKVATSGSDTHNAYSVTGGYGRSWVRVASDAIGAFSPAEFATSMKQQQVTSGSGPFVTMTAQRIGGSPVAIGGTLSVPSGEAFELTVDIQAPEWLQFDSIELFTHAPGRESKDGVPNDTWPESRIAQKKVLDPTALPLEAVPGLNGFNARRVHLVERFTVTATKDTWLVVMVNSSSASRPLYPLVWPWVTCSAGICSASPVRAQSFTNAILIDADGSGAYESSL